MSEMIRFYLEEVMPQAESQDPDIKEGVSSLGEKLKTLRLRLRRCVSSGPPLSPAAAPTPQLGSRHHTHQPPRGPRQGVGWLPGIYM